MRLERLEIQTLPGIEPGFTLADIGPGCNVVTGPNAVGKSSLIRALRYLVAGTSNDDPPTLAMTAVFEGAGGHWTVRRTGREVVWDKDGHREQPPPLPARDELTCYWLSMEDLLQADQQDERLIAALRRALSGGYDLDALRGEAPFLLGKQHGRREARALRDADRALRAVEARYETLRADEAGIPELERDIQLAREAAGKAERLERALVLLEACRARHEVEAGLAEFPGQMERLSGDEVGRLGSLEERREELGGLLAAQGHMREDAGRRLRETGLADGRPESTELQICAGDLDQARRKADQRAQKQEELEQAAAAEQQALGALGGEGATPRLDPDSVSQAETLASGLQAAQGRRQQLQDRLEGAGQAPDQARVDRHARAVEALRDWLASAGGISGRQRAAIVLAAAGGLMAAAAAMFAHAWFALVGGGIGFLGALWALFESRGADHAASRRRFDRCGLEAPEAWRREAVRARLEAIEGERGGLQQQALHAQQAQEARQEFDRVERELEALEQERATMAKRCGFDPALSAAALDRFVRLVHAYEQAHNQRETAKAAIARLDGDVEALTGKLRKFLDRWPAGPPGNDALDPLDTIDLGAIDTCLRALRHRSEQAEAAERDRQDAERERARIEEDLARVDASEATLFTEAGLEPGERRELTRRCEQLDAWRARQDDLRNARVLEAERRKALGGEETLLGRVEANERDALKRDLGDAKAQAEGLERLQEELTTIRTRLREAGLDHRLEEAAALVAADRASLEDKYHEALFADAAHVLLDGVQQEYQSEHEPEVLRDARDRFLRFTHHAFELELDEDEGFMARDVKQQARRNLAELSSATRMQLLLAMRLAWTSRIERGGEALPLFLDEALTTSDEQRFGQVAASLEQLAKEEGRQVFYLSARRHELALWERATGERPHHIDLAAVRFGRTDAAPDDFALPETEALPLPDGQSPERYAAELGVPPVDPRRPEGALHLFHLLRDDLPLIHVLMDSWRTTSLGQLETLLRSSSASDAIPDPDRRKRLLGRCAVARTWIAAWREGRGKPVDRIALEESGTVSAAFIDGVAELADSLGGDAVALIDALRDGKVSRFRSTSTEELAEWLASEGYIDPGEPLNAGDRERRALLAAASGTTHDDIRQVVCWLDAGRPGT